MFQTEHEFTLPMGYLDKDGTLHRDGLMRLATAADEILPLKDPRVQKNPAYLTVILLSRVVARVGSVDPVTPNVIEGLFAADLAYLQALYNEINRVDEGTTVVCPQCQHAFATEDALAGGSWATPSISSVRR
jgi:phage FluMu protein gp41